MAREVENWCLPQRFSMAVSIGAEAKIRVIALEAGRTLLLEKGEVILAAQRAKITVLGR